MAFYKGTLLPYLHVVVYSPTSTPTNSTHQHLTPLHTGQTAGSQWCTLCTYVYAQLNTTCYVTHCDNECVVCMCNGQGCLLQRQSAALHVWYCKPLVVPTWEDGAANISDGTVRVLLYQLEKAENPCQRFDQNALVFFRVKLKMKCRQGFQPFLAGIKGTFTVHATAS